MSSSPRFAALVGLTLTCLGLAGAPEVETANGINVRLVPRRVFFTGRTRSAEVHLINSSPTPVTYRIELAERQMLPNGRLEEIAQPAPDGYSARSFLQYSPRQVTLQPRSTQTVRLLLRKPADLPPGEYRSHLKCRALPPASREGNAVKAEPEARRLNVQLIMLPAITIPIIVRHGDGLAAKVRLTGLTLHPGKDRKSPPTLSFQVNREGPISVFGDLSLVFVPKRGGGTRELAARRGIAVYRELEHLDGELALALAPGEILGSGRLRLTFLSRPEDDGRGSPVAAAAELELP